MYPILPWLSCDSYCCSWCSWNWWFRLIRQFTPEAAVGNCVYCNHCQPCLAGIDIGIVNKYYDLSLAGDKMAHNYYDKLKVKADACLKCGHCDKRCPFKVE